MHNPTIRVPHMNVDYHSKKVYEHIGNLRALLGTALTDEIAAELGKLLSDTYSAGYRDGGDEASNEDAGF